MCQWYLFFQLVFTSSGPMETGEAVEKGRLSTVEGDYCWFGLDLSGGSQLGLGAGPRSCRTRNYLGWDYHGEGLKWTELRERYSSSVRWGWRSRRWKVSFTLLGLSEAPSLRLWTSWDGMGLRNVCLVQNPGKEHIVLVPNSKVILGIFLCTAGGQCFGNSPSLVLPGF